MLIDEVKIKVTAGRGGNGIVAFDNSKFALGPSGGNGGNGGNAYLKGTHDLTALRRFQYKKDFFADNGERGGQNKRRGENGADLILIVPFGTVVHNLTTGEDIEIMSEEPVLIVKGGRGGKGNFVFKSSINTSPQESTPGLDGDFSELILELRLIADIGLIGLPNAGKSSFLNEMTKASVKVADYPFTTLEPNLGSYKKVIIADIPGLIEGAAEGKGLGHKFLKHIRRTKIFFHLIASNSDDVERDYKVIREELGEYDKTLLEKPEYILLTKIDTVSEEELEEKINILRKLNENILPVSIHDPDAIEKAGALIESI